MSRLAVLAKGRLLRLLVGAFAAYALVAWLTDAPELITIMNGIGISVAGGVCVAYAPVIPAAITRRAPTKGDLLGTGIFLVSLSVFGMRAVSVVARDLGWPGISNTDWRTAMMFTCLLGGVLHLWAPTAAEGRIPRAHWLSTGIIVAVSLFLITVFWNLHSSAPHPLVELR